MSFPKYEEYQDSGFDWLGKIPSNWSVNKFRHLFIESSEKIESEIHGEMLSVSGYRGVEVKEYADENQKRSEENLIGYRIVHEGQLVVNTMWLNYTGLGISQLEGYVSPAYRSYWVKSGLHKPFVHYLMRSGLYVLGYTKYLTGVRPNSLQMGRDDLMSFPIVVPSIEEQKSIASFLDSETLKINALVDEQERLIEILKVKRQAVISSAVTKGLNPLVKMKESGLEWLGKVPEKWCYGKLRWLSKRYSGGTPDKKNIDFWTNGTIPWINSGSVNDRLITECSTFITEDAFNSSSAKWIPKGSLVMALAGQGRTKGMVAQLGIDTTCNQSMAAIIPAERLAARYLYYWLEANYENIRNMAGGDLRDGLNLEMLGNIPCPIPEIKEQDEIFNFLDKEINKIDSLIDQSKSGISLLDERRSALISAAVIGQIDVRNYQPKEVA
jgi:type I restriction enzyme S subunit